jgi:soluble lytic murein transglycosylase-like protein
VAAAALSACLIAGGPLLLTPAQADTTAQASAKVQALLAKVHAVQAKVKAAEARYSQAFSAVTDSVNTAISADQDSGTIETAAQTTEANLMAQVRGLYESGGQLAADAAVLNSGNITEAYDRSEIEKRIVQAQEANVRAATIAAIAASQEARQAEKRAHLRIGTERTIAVAATRVQGLLIEQQTLLAKANAHLAAVKAAAAELAAETSTFSSITTINLANLHILPPSQEYLHLYKTAAPTCPGLSWTVLAAIGQVESGHGRNVSTSSAGAMGPMQFEPGTFAAYAVDGDHDGQTDIMDPADAIFTAAHYLCANGAGRGPSALNGAILHYNHAAWYVEMVLKLAGMYATQDG